MDSERNVRFRWHWYLSPVSLFSVTLLLCSGCERPKPRGTSLTVVGLSLDTAEQVRTDALEKFTRETGVVVETIPAWGNSSSQLVQFQKRLSQHAATPDLYVVDSIWTGTLGQYFLDLKSHLDDDVRNHLAELLDNDTVQGRVVCLPFYLNVGTLYYRTDLLKKYHYAHPPLTWNELESMAARIQKGERAAGNAAFWGFVWQGAPYEGLTCNALEWQGAYGGGRLIEADRSVSVDNPRTAEALDKASRWVGTISPRTVLSYGESDSLNLFRSGNAAFVRLWSATFSSRMIADSPVRGLVQSTVLPAGPRGRVQMLGGAGVCVSKYSAHPRESIELALYLTSAEVQLRRARMHGMLPTFPRLFDDPSLRRAMPLVRQLQALGRGAWVARPSAIVGSQYAEISRAYYETVHRVLAGEVSADEVLPGLKRRLEGILGNRQPSEVSARGGQ